MEQLFRFPESTSRIQTHIITIPSLQEIKSIRVNTGNATVVKVEGDKVTIQVQNGVSSKRVQTGGSYTPASSKTENTTRTGTAKHSIDTGTETGYPPSSISFNSGGYSGTLSQTSLDWTGSLNWSSNGDYWTRTWKAYYSGIVTRPASDTRTYAYYFQYDVTVDYIGNTAPTISQKDANLGDRNKGFTLSYTVNDDDLEDSILVIEKLNGSVTKIINSAPRNEELLIEVTDETLFSLPLNSENTIEIKADDQKGGIAYRRYTFRRTNTAPIISGKDEDLGQKTETFSIDFSVSDNEGNAITVKTYLNNILKEEYQVTDGATNTFTITKNDWIKLPIGQHSIKIEAIDEHGATAVRNYTFERYDDRIQFTLKNPIETDIMTTKILVTPTWIIPIGAIAKIEACNNAFDENPTWEDITSQVLISRHYNFINNTKTANKWGIDIRFTIEKGTATEECIIHGFGGAFE